MSAAALHRQSLRMKAAQRGLALFVAILAVVGLQAAHSPQGARLMAATASSDDITVAADETGVAPMPFERPGDSFPGSAYYYMASDEAPAKPDSSIGGALSSLLPGAESAAPTTGDILPNSGPAARAVAQTGTAIDRTRAIDCLTAAIYYEAASEPDNGQRAVAQVILNRVAHPSFPKTVCGVVYQGSERTTGCQFTFTCDGALNRKPSRYFWDRAQKVARDALSGYVYAPVGLATHYHTFAVHPYWADSLNFIGQIGAHRFYRFNGPAGTPNAFRFAYAGGEPLPTVHAHTALAAAHADAAPADPLMQERAYEASLHSAGARPVAAPAYTPEVMHHGGDTAYRAANLPGADTSVRPEYQGSGTWIGEPQ